MAAEEESISAAAMAEDAAERARRQILALYRRGEVHGIGVVADTVAEDARLGAIDAVAGQPATMSCADAEVYAAAAAAGAVAASMHVMAGLSGTGTRANANGSCSRLIHTASFVGVVVFAVFFAIMLQLLSGQR